MRLFLVLCVAWWALPVYAQDSADDALPAGEMSVEELQDLTPEPADTTSSSKKIDIPSPTEPDVVREEKKPAAKPFNAVMLKGLNKVTARSITLNANMGTVMRFGNLEIIAHRCVERMLHGRPDHAALLEIWELKPDTSPTKLFQGWMFSSNQAIAALEHPVYDVWVEACAINEMKE